MPLAADAPAVVVEANFRPYHEYELDRICSLAAHPVEVQVVKTLGLEAMAEYDRRPAGVGTLVTVDTTAPVDTRAVAAAVLQNG